MAEKPADGKFSPTYFLFGGGIADWLRPFGDDLRRLAVYGIIALLIWFVISTIFPRKPQGNVSRPDNDNTVIMTPGTKVEGGIHLESRVDTSQKVEEKKRPRWMPIPYIAAFGEARSKGGRIDDYDTGFGGQVGVRIDFN